MGAPVGGFKFSEVSSLPRAEDYGAFADVLYNRVVSDVLGDSVTVFSKPCSEKDICSRIVNLRTDDIIDYGKVRLLLKKKNYIKALKYLDWWLECWSPSFKARSTLDRAQNLFEQDKLFEAHLLVRGALEHANELLSKTSKFLESRGIYNDRQYHLIGCMVDDLNEQCIQLSLRCQFALSQKNNSWDVMFRRIRSFSEGRIKKENEARFGKAGVVVNLHKKYLDSYYRFFAQSHYQCGIYQHGEGDYLTSMEQQRYSLLSFLEISSPTDEDKYQHALTINAIVLLFLTKVKNSVIKKQYFDAAEYFKEMHEFLDAPGIVLEGIDNCSEYLHDFGDYCENWKGEYYHTSAGEEVIRHPLEFEFSYGEANADASQSEAPQIEAPQIEAVDRVKILKVFAAVREREMRALHYMCLAKRSRFFAGNRDRSDNASCENYYQAIRYLESALVILDDSDNTAFPRRQSMVDYIRAVQFRCNQQIGADFKSMVRRCASGAVAASSDVDALDLAKARAPIRVCRTSGAAVSRDFFATPTASDSKGKENYKGLFAPVDKVERGPITPDADDEVSSAAPKSPVPGAAAS
ncbi:MAG: hypothetical protein K0U29_06640 [Gammaproteobacteria bacterium]|nr:hypothetical protein [Gammaproteobacteria bacterium]